MMLATTATVDVFVQSNIRFLLELVQNNRLNEKKIKKAIADFNFASSLMNSSKKTKATPDLIKE